MIRHLRRRSLLAASLAASAAAAATAVLPAAPAAAVGPAPSAFTQSAMAFAGPSLHAIYVRDLFTGSVYEVAANTSAELTSPVISPNGQYVAYTRTIGSTSRIRVAAFDGSGGAQFCTQVQRNQSMPDWASDSTIVYNQAGRLRSCSRGNAGHDYLTGAENGRFNSNQTKIAYENTGNGDIYTANVTGGVPGAGTSTGIQADNASFQPGGSDLLLDTPHGITLMSGSSAHRIDLAGSSANFPVWSDDGTEVYYTHDGNIYSIDASTGEYISKVVGGRNPSTSAHLQPRQRGSQTYFTPETATKILDTRTASRYCAGIRNGPAPLGGGQHCKLTIGGHGGVPSGSNIKAVVLNIVAINPTKDTFLSASPTTRSNKIAHVRSLSVPAGHTVDGTVQVRLGTGQQVTFYNRAGNLNFEVFVQGWFTGVPTGSTTIPHGGFHVRAPQRVVDTRSSTGCGTLAAGGRCKVTLAGRYGIASDAQAAVLNVTAIKPTANTYLEVFGQDHQPLDAMPQVNIRPGGVRSTVLTAPIRDGGITVYNLAGHTDVTVDILGTYDNNGTGASFYPAITPIRIVDTVGGVKTFDGHAHRIGASGISASAAGTITTRDGAAKLAVPEPAAVLLTVTGEDPTRTTTITTHPWGSSPGRNTLTVGAGGTVSNAFVSRVSHGQISFYNSSGSVNLLADEYGFYN